MFGKKASVKRGLKIIIVGCGKVGVTLVEQLSKEGHDITIIDKDAGRIAFEDAGIGPADAERLRIKHDRDDGRYRYEVEFALIKEAAMQHAYISYVLADSSKFRRVSSVTFAKIGSACIITDTVPDERYKKLTVIKTVEGENSL